MPKFDSNSAKAAKAKAAGRGESKARKWLREASDKQTTIEVFNKLLSLARNGDMDAIKTYLAYVVGKPKDTVEIQGNPDLPVVFKLDGKFKDATG